MADSIPDLHLSGSWVNLYATMGIPVGTAILVQNKGSNSILMYISATEPTLATDGYAIAPLEVVAVDAGESGLWLKGEGPAFVQLN